MNTHSTTSNEGWIEWNGGECPVAPFTLIEVRRANGREVSGYWSKRHSQWLRTSERSGDNIIAYRIVEQGK